MILVTVSTGVDDPLFEIASAIAGSQRFRRPTNRPTAAADVLPFLPSELLFRDFL